MVSRTSAHPAVTANDATLLHPVHGSLLCVHCGRRRDLAVLDHRHVGAGDPVAIRVRSSGVEVTYRSGHHAGAAATRPVAEGSRGLHLVDSLAPQWGFEQHDCHTTTWSELPPAP